MLPIIKFMNIINSYFLSTARNLVLNLTLISNSVMLHETIKTFRIYESVLRIQEVNFHKNETFVFLHVARKEIRNEILNLPSKNSKRKG